LGGKKRLGRIHTRKNKRAPAERGTVFVESYFRERRRKF